MSPGISRLEARDLTFDLRGHHSLVNGPLHRSPSEALRWRERAFFEFLGDDERGLPHYLHFDNGLSDRCELCDEHLSYERNGSTFTATSACSYVDEPVVVEIDVPSGRLVVDDDLRLASDDEQVFDFATDHTKPSINTLLGQQLATREVAELGVFFGTASNSTVVLERLGEGRYALTDNDPRYADEFERIIPADRPELATSTFEADVVTDLWGVMLADEDHFVALGGKPVSEYDAHGTRSLVRVRPGRYRITHRAVRKGFDTHLNNWHEGQPMRVWSDIEWVDECDRVLSS